jgi:hypothetical protein
MLLIKDDDQWWDITKVRTLENYMGICNSCGTPLEYPGTFEAIIVKQEYNMDVLAPLIHFHCPSCLHPIKLFYRWNSMNVSTEFNMLNKE